MEEDKLLAYTNKHTHLTMKRETIQTYFSSHFSYFDK